MRPFRPLPFAVASAFVVASVAVNEGCSPASVPSAPMTASSATATATPAGARSMAPSTSGELETAAEVTFEVRPLSGPGTMGPTGLAAKSDTALEEIRAYLAAHPDAGRLHIECSSINPMRMSSSPDAKWPAGLALQIAHWLVDHGIDCKRLEAVGWLDADLDAKERVRFFIERKARERPASKEARLDVCARSR